MWIEATCRLELDYEHPTPMILMLRPRSGAGQWVASESYEFSRSVEVNEYTDGYGNLCQKLIAPADGFVIETRARVSTPDRVDQGRHSEVMPDRNVSLVAVATPATKTASSGSAGPHQPAMPSVHTPLRSRADDTSRVRRERRRGRPRRRSCRTDRMRPGTR